MKSNYLIYFWDFSSKIPQSPPKVRKNRYLLLKIRNFLQKNERNRFTTAVPVHNGEPVRAVVVPGKEPSVKFAAHGLLNSKTRKPVSNGFAKAQVKVMGFCLTWERERIII